MTEKGSLAIPFLIGVALLISGCVTPLIHQKAVLPSEVQFEAGDIVVSSGADLKSWLLFLMFRPAEWNLSSMELPPSHTEMVFRNHDGILYLGGVHGDGQTDSAPLAERLSFFGEYRVYRAQSAKQDRERAAKVLMQLLSNPAVSNAPFDYSFGYTPGKRDTFFCAGIVNEACRLADLPLPFLYLSWQPNSITTQIQKFLQANIEGILDMESIEVLEQYQCIFTAENKKPNPERDKFIKALALYVITQYENGWQLKPSASINLPLMYSNLPPNSETVVRFGKTVDAFGHDALTTRNKFIRRKQRQLLSQEEQVALVQTIGDKFREKYFYHTPSTTYADKRLYSPPDSGKGH